MLVGNYFSTRKVHKVYCIHKMTNYDNSAYRSLYFTTINNDNGVQYCRLL